MLRSDIVALFTMFNYRFQNQVYTYRILPNEDKKLSVQVGHNLFKVSKDTTQLSYKAKNRLSPRVNKYILKNDLSYEGTEGTGRCLQSQTLISWHFLSLWQTEVKPV